jgi:hypothetical protein
MLPITDVEIFKFLNVNLLIFSFVTGMVTFNVNFYAEYCQLLLKSLTRPRINGNILIYAVVRLQARGVKKMFIRIIIHISGRKSDIRPFRLAGYRVNRYPVHPTPPPPRKKTTQ